MGEGIRRLLITALLSPGAGSWQELQPLGRRGLCWIEIREFESKAQDPLSLVWCPAGGRKNKSGASCPVTRVPSPRLLLHPQGATVL